MLFTMYIKPLSAIIDSHYHTPFICWWLAITDVCSPNRLSGLLHSMQSCVGDVNGWATANMLKLNDNKTELGSTLDVTSYLQRIQNYAARVILRLPMSSRITTHLKSLHWLPVKVRSIYKIACLCYNCHSSTAPSYVADMLQKKPSHACNTRSTSYTMPLLNRPAHSRAALGDCSFSLLLLLSGTLFQMMSGVPHHCHHLCLVWRHTYFFQFAWLNFILDHCTYVDGLALLWLCW